ncbi:MAG TPA: histidine kinase [Chitinophagaceae bacterium]|nr:histidine kinase [Chitinophagaceae bacterium]
MKIKWRQHELMAVTLLTVFAAIRYFLRMFSGAPFAENVAFYKKILLAQYAVLLIQYGCYIWLNKVIIAKLQPASQQKAMPKYGIAQAFIRYGLLSLQFVVIIYLLGPVSNFIAYSATRSFADPAMANLVNSVFPAHPQELCNTFGGFDITLFFVGIYMLYVVLREAVIYLAGKKNGRLLYAAITNQLTLLGLVLVAVQPLMYVILPGDVRGPLGVSVGTIFYILAPSVYVVYLVEAYWLFPQKGDKPLLHPFITSKLLLLTAICAMPAMFLHSGQSDGPWAGFFTGWLFHLIVTTPLSWLVYQQRKDRILQLRNIEKELGHSTADIQFLRSQINPHFLFNVLNTLYGTALQEDAARTAEGIQKLGDMMRFMLHDNNRENIPLQREVQYLNNYIALQTLRIQQSPNITVQADMNDAGCNHNIAPMLLIPFVENAFKHGISLVEPSWINIKLSCDKGGIFFSVHNSMHEKKENDTEQYKSGIGIVNVKKRLQLVYPGRYTLKFNADGREFFVHLNIQL